MLLDQPVPTELVSTEPVSTQASSPELPSPPTDRERDAYLGRQHRWLLLAQAVSFAMIAYSIARFATADTRLLLFLIPMSLYAVTSVVSLLSSTRSRRISYADHRDRVSAYRPASYPSVDVFLPSAGEPLAVLRNTYQHVAQLQWPGELVVHVLDDSARPGVRDLAEASGFRYHCRPDRGRLKKAGNLRYGYQHSDGDLIVVLDADFVPRTDFLAELVPYLDEPDVGIVQSPQYFDTSSSMGWLQRCAGATQELFYRWIQPSRDRSRAAICVGTCAVYRRAALEQAGGFAQIGHSEDVHTGVNLLKAGYFLRYVPSVVAKGMCPDDLAGFLNQQYRWCTGSMSLLSDPEFHRTPELTWRQRVCFWAGFLYYISTGVNAVVAPLPALAMLWFLPEWIEPMNSIWLLGALLLWLAVLPMMMRGRWRIDVLRVQLLYSFAHAVAIWHVLLGRTREWVATGAAAGRTTPVATTVGRVVRSYAALTQGLIYLGLWRGASVYGLDRYWAMLLLATLSAYIHLPVVTMGLGGWLRTTSVKLRQVVGALSPARSVPVPAVALADARGADGGAAGLPGPSPQAHPGRGSTIVLTDDPVGATVNLRENAVDLRQLDGQPR
ncbi:MAG: glycosyltransferase family 2 protein [Angustibacter sp.]